MVGGSFSFPAIWTSNLGRSASEHKVHGKQNQFNGCIGLEYTILEVIQIQKIDLPSAWTRRDANMAISIAIASIRSRAIFDIYAKEQKVI